MRDGSLVLQPSFQRKLVWNDKHKEDFLETILLKLPFPEVYFADGEIDLDEMVSTTLVVDGQQRLNTIYQYITNSPELKLKKIPSFSELSQKEKEDFLDYIVVVRDLNRRTVEEIRDIFRRINSVQYALNAMEINNALYEGEYINVAKDIVNSKLLSDLDVLSETERIRMRDLEFVITIMTTIELNGYFNSTREVEGFIKKYENEYPNAKKMKESFIRVLNYIKELNLPLNSMWLKKTCMFTLIVELMFSVYCNEKELPNKESCVKLLLDLEKHIMKSNKIEDGDKYQEFYNYIYQGTASRKGRITRGELLRSELTGII